MGDPAVPNAKKAYLAETLAWWRPLVEPQEPGKRSNRGELAALRRCKNLEEVFFVPAYHGLYFRVSALDWKHRESVAAVAGVLAHVKGDSAQTTGSKPAANHADQPPADQTVDDRGTDRPTKKFAAFLASPAKPGLGPRVSELRFQRLVAIRDLRALYPSLLRVIHLAGDRVPVEDLIRSIRFWSERTGRDWVQHYYDALLQQPPKNRAQGA